MNLFRFPRPISSAPVARKRLQTLLEYERGLLDRDLFTVLCEEILSCVSRYVTVDPDKVQLRVRLKTSSRIAELSQHEADGGELQEGEAAAVEIFPVLGEAAAAIEPSNRAFYDPTLG